MKKLLSSLTLLLGVLTTGFGLNVDFPTILVTSMDNFNVFTGVDTNQGAGTFTVADTNVTFNNGDTSIVTIAASAGNKFQLNSGATGNIGVTYGSAFINNDVPSGITVTFNGLSGGAAPSFTPVGQSGTPLFSGSSGLFVGSATAPWTVASTVTFDSVTFEVDTTTASAITVSSVPVGFSFYAGTGELSLVPVPEPSSYGFLSGLIALSAICITRRRY